MSSMNEADGVVDDEEEGRSAWAMTSAVVSNVLLFFLIFGMSATVDTKSLKHQLQNKFAVGTGVAMQFIIMPFLGYIAVTLTQPYGLSEATGITLLVVTSSPGGSYSNWWCSLFNADLALSVAMTSVSSLLSTALLPLNLFFYTYLTYRNKKNENGESVIQALDFETIFISLAVVLSSILSGLYAGYRYDSILFHERANRLGSICGLLLVIFSIVVSSNGDSETKLWNQHWTCYVAVATPCIGGLVIATIMARLVRLSRPETVTIAIECCYQNTGIATSVAITMFSNAEERAQAVAVPLFYGVIEAIVVGLYCVYAWKIGWTKAPADEKFCTVISKTYEVAPADDDDDKKYQAAEEMDVNHATDVEEASPAEAAALQRHPGFFSQVLFGHKRPQEPESEKALRKRIVSDFTADTSLTSEAMQSSTARQDSADSIPVHTIIEGGCESSEHIESDDLDNDDDDDESQGSTARSNPVAETMTPPDLHSQESLA